MEVFRDDLTALSLLPINCSTLRRGFLVCLFAFFYRTNGSVVVRCSSHHIHMLSILVIHPSIFPSHCTKRTHAQRNDGSQHYRPAAASTQYRPQQQLPPGSAQGSGSDEGILSTLSSGFNSLVNNIFG